MVPWSCLPVFGVWRAVLTTTTPHFLTNHSAILSVVFQMLRAAAPNIWSCSSVNSPQLNHSFLKCAFKPK